MLLNCKCEFRGFNSKITEKGTFSSVNLEDSKGDACKFPLDNGLVEVCHHLSKGDIVDALLDYNITYKSLKVVNIQKVGK